VPPPCFERTTEGACTSEDASMYRKRVNVKSGVKLNAIFIIQGEIGRWMLLARDHKVHLSYAKS